MDEIHELDHPSSESRVLLAKLISEKTQKPKYAPLSFAQERLWFLSQLEPDNPGFNMPMAVRLMGRLNVAALKQSLNEIVRRHETLRTSFVAQDGRPVQLIFPFLILPLPLIDLQDLDAEREMEVHRLIAAEARRPFDPARVPLLRSDLIRLGEEEYVIFLNVHHLVSDGWSEAVLLRELTALYGALAYGRPSPLAELPVQYADFAQWQRQSLQADTLKEQLAYWKQQLVGPLPGMELVTDRPHSSARVPGVVRQIRIFPQSLTDSLKALSRQEGVTLFMTLLATFKTLLLRYTGQTDMIVGSPIANRDRTEVEGMIGLFINTLVLRTDLSGNPAFVELLSRVRQVVLEAFAHKALPFERLVEELDLERDLNRNPLFRSVFILQDAYPTTLGLPDVRLKPVPIEVAIDVEAPDALSISIQETSEGLVSVLEHKTGLLNPSPLNHLRTLLESIVADPHQRLSDLPLLTKAEYHQLHVEWNDTAANYPQNRYIHEFFEAQVDSSPDAVAVIFEDEHFSYGELNRRTNQLACYLRGMGVGPEVRVGICMERSLEMVMGLLGVLKAGGVYVPLDPTYPRKRLAFMLEDVRAPVLLVQERLVAGLPEHEAHLLCLDTGWQAVAQADDRSPVSRVRADNLIYIIYTSGSTGWPKGAMNTHSGICNRLLWMQDAYQLTRTDRVLQKTSFSFDVSGWEFFWPLLVGACLVVAQPEGHKDSAYLVKTIVEQNITTLHFVPPMLRVFLEEPGLEACRSLKRVFCSGEALPVDLQERFFARLDAELHNLYGPTEAAIDVTFWACEREYWRSMVPIGRPIANTQIYLVDHHWQLVPVGVADELYIGGAGLARGYLNRPDLTAEKFVPHPFSNEPGARLYRTGDLACYQPDGNIVFLGRVDHQVKLRGFRIELGEIESVLGRHPAVREAVALVREDHLGDKRLVAYVTPGQEHAPTIDDLRAFVQKQLPDYMVPSAFVSLDALPLTPSGKVDRRALPPPDVSLHKRPRFVAPSSPLEVKLAEIWTRILGVEQVGIHDNFFELGGHSLLVTQVISQINKTLKVDLSVRSLFEEPTVARLALLIEETLIEELENEGEED